MPAPPELTLDQILHIAELLSIAGGAITIAFKIGSFTQTVKDSNANFVREMEDSKKDRAGIHEEIKKLADAMHKDSIFDLRITNIETDLKKIETWYDELRHGRGLIKS